MRNRRLIALALTAVMSLSVCALPAAAEEETSGVCFFVAQNGDDGAEGTKDKPLATIEGARDKVRAYKDQHGMPDGGITVYFREGNYKITDTVEFDERDSGRADSPITYKSYNNEKVMWNGGVYVPVDKLTPITDTEVTRRIIDQSAVDHLVQLDLGALGLTDDDIGKIPVSCGNGKDHYWEDGKVADGKVIRDVGVYVDDSYMTLARYPNKDYVDSNKGWSYIKKALVAGASWDWATGQRPKFEVNDTERLRMVGWKDKKDIHLYGYCCWDFFHDDVLVSSISDSGEVILADTINSGVADNKRYYLYNILEELDAPGEYYIDREKKIMYMYPPHTLSDKNVVKLATYAKQWMIRCKDVSNVTFEGLDFELTRGSIFNMVGGTNMNIRYCSIKNAGVNGAWLGSHYAPEGIEAKRIDLDAKLAECYDNAANGTHYTVYGCDMMNIGYSGIKLFGGNMYTLERADFTVENNKIHNWGLKSGSYDNAINFGGFGMRLAHNEMFTAPNGAIQGQGQGIIVEYNNIYDVLREVEDAGALYCNYCTPDHDVIMRYNYIHDIPWAKYPDGKTYGHVSWDEGVSMRCGLYTDTNFFRPQVYGNVFENIPIGYYNSGNAELLYNNVFIDVDRPAGKWIADDMMTGMSGREVLTEEAIANTPAGFAQNWPWDLEAWRKAYPEFYEWFDEWLASDDASDWVGEVRNNLIYFDKKKGTTFYEDSMPESRLKWIDSENFIYEDNIITDEDPGFVDAKNGNYQLREDASIFKLNPNFKMIDMSLIGLTNGMAGASMKKSVALKLGSPKALANDEVVSVDSENPDVMPVISDDRTLVPVRFVSENMGADVTWDEAAQTANIEADGKKIALTVGSDEIVVDGQATKMDTTTQIINGRTMIPLRALAEVGLDKSVYYDKSGLIVIGEEAHLLDRKTTDKQTLARIEERLK